MVYRTTPLVMAAAAAVTLAAAAPAGAAEGAWLCDASALRGTVLSGSVIEPATANRGSDRCRTASATLAQLPAPLTAAAGLAATRVEGSAPAEQRTLATGGVTSLKVVSAPELPITLPEATVPESFGAVVVPLSIPLLPSSITIDIRPAVRALLPANVLPRTDLVRVDGAVASAAGLCRDGFPQLVGGSSVAGLAVLGQAAPTDAAVSRTLGLIDAGEVDPSAIDLSLVALPAGLSFSDPVHGDLLTAAVRAVLDTLPDVAVPGTVAAVKVTPLGSDHTAGALVQRALRIEASIAGQPLADLTVGEARLAAAGISCDEIATATPSPEAALDCTRRRIVLEDVVPRRRSVLLVGAADRSLVGRTVRFVFDATGRTVARARVRPDGSFRARAALPSRRLRAGNRARYQAVIGKERSLDLKLMRRMRVESVRERAGRVTIAGRVTGPLARPVARVEVRRRVTCRTWKVVRRVRPGRDGRFRVTVSTPRGADAAVFRLATRVRKTTSNRRTYPTFTLPRSVDLR